MARGELYLGEDVGSLQLLSPFARKFNVGNTLLAREDRTASGRLVRDVIATKKEFTLRYRLIDGDDLIKYLNLYDLNEELLFRQFLDDTAFNDYTVLMDPINHQRVLSRDDGLWEGVTVVLKEV